MGTTPAQPKFTVLNVDYAKELYKLAKEINTGVTYNELSTTGKTVVSAINELKNVIAEYNPVVDSSVMSGSTNAVAGGAVYEEIQRADANELVKYVLGQDISQNKVIVNRNYDIDETLIPGSHNPVASHVLQKVLDDLAKTIHEQLGLTVDTSGLLNVVVNENRQE